MNGRALSFLGPMTQLQDELWKELLIDQIHHGSPTGHRQEEVRCIIGFQQLDAEDPKCMSEDI